jgi:two-component system OmpR family response regulator
MQGNPTNSLQSTNDMALITYIVEDSATIRENLISTLEEIAPVKVVGFAETEQEASLWLSMNNGNWQLAIVDLFLKEGSGLGVLKGCQSRNSYQKVVVLTNYATDDIRRRCSELGSDAVFDKSNELDQLLEYCSSVTENNLPSPGAMH